MRIDLLKPITSDEEHDAVVARIDEIFDPEPGTPEAAEFQLLIMLSVAYEKEYHPIDPPDPIEAIKYRMEEMGLNQKELAEVVGWKSRASEILNRKRKLTLEMIRSLHEKLGIPAEVLIKAY